MKKLIKIPLSTYVTPANKKWLDAKARREKLPLCKLLDRVLKEARGYAA